MFILTTWALRLFGISGILGGVLFICGDLSYNHIPGSAASPAVKMSKMPASRLFTAGTLGLFGCWLYTLAAMHVYLAFRPAGEIYAFILLLAFAAVMISFGISHTAYFSIAAGARAAASTGSDPEAGAQLGSTLFKRLVNITYVPVAVFSLMMLYGIAAGRSLYPRWMLIFLPILLYLLKTPIVHILKGRVRELVNDSYDNLVLFVFFTVSTLVLWNGIVV